MQESSRQHNISTIFAENEVIGKSSQQAILSSMVWMYGEEGDWEMYLLQCGHSVEWRLGVSRAQLERTKAKPKYKTMYDMRYGTVELPRVRSPYTETGFFKRNTDKLEPEPLPSLYVRLFPDLPGDSYESDKCSLVDSWDVTRASTLRTTSVLGVSSEGWTLHGPKSLEVETGASNGESGKSPVRHTG